MQLTDEQQVYIVKDSVRPVIYRYYENSTRPGKQLKRQEKLRLDLYPTLLNSGRGRPSTVTLNMTLTWLSFSQISNPASVFKKNNADEIHDSLKPCQNLQTVNQHKASSFWRLVTLTNICYKLMRKDLFQRVMRLFTQLLKHNIQITC